MFIFDKIIDIIADRVALQTYEKERRHNFKHNKALQKEKTAYKVAVQNVLDKDNLNKIVVRMGDYSSVEMEMLFLRLFDVSKASVRSNSAARISRKANNTVRGTQIKEFVITSNCDFLFPRRPDLLPEDVQTVLRMTRQRPTTIETTAYSDDSYVSQAKIDVRSTGLNLNYGV